MQPDSSQPARKRENLVELSNEQKSKLRQRVEQKGGQKAVAELTDIPAPTLSKILALDTYQRVNQTTIQALLDALDLSNDFQEEKTHLRIGFGFTLWSAPIILGLHTKGWFKDCDLSSFYKKIYTEDGVEQHLPQWDEGNGEALIGPWAHPEADVVGKDLYRKNAPEEAKPIEFKSGERFRGYTAQELITSLELTNEPDELDGIIVPRDVIKNREHEFIVVASLIQSVSGSTIVSMITKDNDVYNQINSADSLTTTILKLINAGVEKFVIFYPPGTICEHHYKEYIEPLPDDDEIYNASKKAKLDRSSYQTVKLDDIADPRKTASIIQEFLDEKTKTVAFLLGWLPNNAWILNCIKGAKSKDIDLLGEMSTQKKPGYFEFSLIIRNEERMKRKWLHRSSSLEFLRSLNSAINKINLERSEVISRWVRTDPSLDDSSYIKYFGRSGSVVSSIAHYLNLPINETAARLNAINFSFSINADFFLDNYQPNLQHK